MASSGWWVGGPHQTSGLSGYPARDFGAKGGSPLYAWGTLQVIRISGASGYRGNGFGGYNIYLRDQRGGTYFVTHQENLRVKVGQLVRPGQPISSIGNYGTPHAHIGYTGGDPVSVLGLKPEYLFSAAGAAAGAKVIAAATPKGGSAGGSVGSSGGRTPIGLRTPQFPSIPLPGLPDRPKDPNDLIPSIPGAPSLGDFGDFFSAAAKWLTWPFTNWDRLLEVVGGFILLVVGLILMGRAMGVGGMGRVGGDVMNRLEYGPTVVKGERTVRVHEAYDRPGQRVNPETSEIPF